MTYNGIFLFLSFKAVVVKPGDSLYQWRQENFYIFSDYILYVDFLETHFFQVVFGFLPET